MLGMPQISAALRSESGYSGVRYRSRTCPDWKASGLRTCLYRASPYYPSCKKK